MILPVDTHRLAHQLFNRDCHIVLLAIWRPFDLRGFIGIGMTKIPCHDILLIYAVVLAQPSLDQLMQCYQKTAVVVTIRCRGDVQTSIMLVPVAMCHIAILFRLNEVDGDHLYGGMSSSLRGVGGCSGGLFDFKS